MGIGDNATDYSGDRDRFGFGMDFLYDYFNNNDLGLSLGVFAGNRVLDMTCNLIYF